MNYLEAVALVALVALSAWSWHLTIGGYFTWLKKDFNRLEYIVLAVLLIVAVTATAGVVVLL